MLILGTAGAGYLYYEHLNGNIEKGERSSGDSKADRPEPNAAGQTPLNILLVGSDSRASDANVALGGGRNHRDNPPLGDVQMLIHLAADRKSASVVSIPRDTRVDIPACTDPKTGEKYPATNAIINESLGRGGAGCTLATWEKLTGVYIDHWMTIDFAGVVSMADAVGGVEVCVNQNVWDRPLPAVPGGSGLKMTAGRHKVEGEQALQWLRTRHAWGSDLLRARAQHMYMNSMIRTLKSQNVFTDTGRLMGLAEAATESLTVSEEIGTVKKLYDLGMQLKTVPTDRITMTTMPTVEDPQDGNHLLPAGEDAERMWAMLRDDVSYDDKGGKGGEGGKGGGDTGKGSGSEGAALRARPPRGGAAGPGRPRRRDRRPGPQRHPFRDPRTGRRPRDGGRPGSDAPGLRQGGHGHLGRRRRGEDRGALPERGDGGGRPAGGGVPGHSGEFGAQVRGRVRDHAGGGSGLALGNVVPGAEQTRGRGPAGGQRRPQRVGLRHVHGRVQALPMVGTRENRRDLPGCRGARRATEVVRRRTGRIV